MPAWYIGCSGYNTPVLYYRLHGVPAPYHSRYGPEALQRVAAEVAAATHVQEAYLYFNNDIGGSAIADATWLRAYVGAGR